MFQEIEVGDAVYLRDGISGDVWTPRRCHVIGFSGDLLEVQVFETITGRGYVFKSNMHNFVHEDDFFKARAVRGLLGDPHEWTVSLLLALYYDVMSYAPVGHLLWGEFSKMSEGELREVVQVLEETSACLVKTA